MRDAREKKILRGLLCAALALATAATVSPAAASAASDDARLQKGLDAIRAAGAVGVIAEVRLEGRVWRGSAGSVRLGRQVTPTGKERFRAGSVVKSFVATVVLQLVAERRLRLDDTVGDLLGVGEDKVERADKITVRQLLTHTAGVPEYLPEGEPPGGALANRHRTWRPAELIALARRHPRPFEPGAQQVYSNTNYVLLGMIINRVTGRDFGTEIHRRIVRPLGLKDTEVPGSRPAIKGRYLHGYLNGSDGEPVDISAYNMTVAAGSGNLISTDADLNRFFHALATGRLVRPALVRLMTTGKEYGMGLGLMPTPCGLAIGHTGTAYGYQTMSFHLANGRRQASISYTPRTGRELQATNAMLWKTLCPSIGRAPK
ncbi:serine hydrolase domain-containing protein [Spongiactinospora rosea]|uniref:serine hydrolase domain-containing protein n=1 Tax=Spongiactinospora rosea TaxID=2248750 RepID=UPI001314FC2D|nr:serine hydrolase domain-containing protein [Spongiactinospora rosea]